MQTNRVRIFLANENPALRSALALLLETRLQADIVGETQNMENLFSHLRLARPDIVILDSDLPGLPQKNRVAVLHQKYPGLKVVILGSPPEAPGRPAQADAYISKSEPPEKMVRVLRGIQSKGTSA